MGRLPVTLGASLALLLGAGAVYGASFSNSSFATTSFSENSFSFGADPPVAVPNVVGLDEAAADSALEADGLDTGTVTSVCSAATMGDVVSQAPPAGALVAAGSTVNLFVSSGTPCKGPGGKLRLYLKLRL
jgi:beta-lactam-binding protein with PASTA domain